MTKNDHWPWAQTKPLILPFRKREAQDRFRVFLDSCVGSPPLTFDPSAAASDLRPTNSSDTSVSVVIAVCDDPRFDDYTLTPKKFETIVNALITKGALLDFGDGEPFETISVRAICSAWRSFFGELRQDDEIHEPEYIEFILHLLNTAAVVHCWDQHVNFNGRRSTVTDPFVKNEVRDWWKSDPAFAELDALVRREDNDGAPRLWMSRPTHAPYSHTNTGTGTGTGTDKIDRLNGDDLLDGGAGNDFLYGGTDDDTIYGDTGNDTIGGFGADLLDGGPGSDELRGLVGDDTIYGRGGDDKLFGDKGNDTLSGGKADDLLIGGDSDVDAGDGAAFIYCQSGNDPINARPDNDTVVGVEATDHVLPEGVVEAREAHLVTKFQDTLDTTLLDIEADQVVELLFQDPEIMDGIFDHVNENQLHAPTFGHPPPARRYEDNLL